MKLTKEMKNILKEFGHEESDFPQIERALKVTKYKFYEGEKSEEISRTVAIEKLGLRAFMSGISRSAFHWSSMRTCENGSSVRFDSSKLFK